MALMDARLWECGGSPVVWSDKMEKKPKLVNDNNDFSTE
jgi:hypothetical protein